MSIHEEGKGGEIEREYRKPLIKFKEKVLHLLSKKGTYDAQRDH